jgi:glutathione S-transferase
VKASTNTRRVWGIGTSRTFRPHWMLAELGLPYETRDIITRSKDMEAAEFRALSKRGKIPLYEDGDLMIGESAAIVLFLADRYRGVRPVEGDGPPLPSLAPEAGTDDRARHDEICFFIMTEMDAPLYVIRRHAGLPEIYGESPVAVQAAKEYFLRSTTEIERRLEDRRPFLMGEAFTVADLLLKTCLDWAAFVQISLPDSLAPYSASLGERPAYAVARTKNFTPAALAALAPSS